MRSLVRRVLTTSLLSAGLVGMATGAAAADTYEVQPGDTLSAIADKLDGVDSWQALHAANEAAVPDPTLIVPGQQLALPGRDVAETHEVEQGETIAGIADEYDHVASWRDLASANGISEPRALRIGTILSLVGETTPAEPAPAEEAPAESTPSGVAAPEAPATPTQGTEPESAPEATTTSGVWDRLAECESNQNWSANSGNGYYGGLQFTLQSWEAVGGTGYPHEASREEQIARAEQLLELQGWGAWPGCSQELGLR